MGKFTLFILKNVTKRCCFSLFSYFCAQNEYCMADNTNQEQTNGSAENRLELRSEGLVKVTSAIPTSVMR